MPVLEHAKPIHTRGVTSLMAVGDPVATGDIGYKDFTDHLYKGLTASGAASLLLGWKFEAARWAGITAMGLSMLIRAARK